jgi:glycosyltransferase involved in cell wall biosynthesis
VKKVTFLIDQMHSHGGIEKLVSIKANYWADVFGYEVTIISTEQLNKPLLYSLSPKVSFRDLQINYDRRNSYFSGGNIMKLLKNLFKIQQYLNQEKPDFLIVASHIPITYILPFLWCKGKIVKEFHFSKYNVNNQRFKQKVMNFVEAKYDKLIVLSEEERTFYPSKNTIVIPNPIPDNSSEIIPVSMADKENKAVFVGRLAPVKQLEKLISIWGKFVQLNPDWTLHIFGDADFEYDKILKNSVTQKELDNFIVFRGNSNTISQELTQSKVLLMTSKHECFPMVILEAFAAGVPVISFDCPTGPRNIITNHQDGILVANANEEAYVETLVSFANNIESQEMLSKNAFNKSKQFELTSVMNQWKLQLFDHD